MKGNTTLLCTTTDNQKRIYSTNILKRNKNASLFQWKIHGLQFKVLDRENGPSIYQNIVKKKYQLQRSTSL